jgi:zinc transport system substrate-binding protein
MRHDSGSLDVLKAVLISAAIIAGGAVSFSLVEAPSSDDGKLVAIASFYPLYFFSSQIAGDLADVRCLMPDNAEPHSWEPRPSDLMRTDRADIFIYNGAGFEPWVESFIGSLTNDAIISVDTSQGIEERDEGADPHFWLDPISAKAQADNILSGFLEADPSHAAEYQANTNSLKARLDALDAAFEEGLANRTKNDIVTTHEGFDYLAARYGFNAYAAVGISGDQQPSAADLARLTQLVNDLGLAYVYSEPTYSDAVIETLARETGTQILILDGVHGRSGVHAKMDYFQIMYEDLEALRIGLEVTEVAG